MRVSRDQVQEAMQENQMGVLSLLTLKMLKGINV